MQNIYDANNIKNCWNPYFGGTISLAPVNNITKILSKLFCNVLKIPTKFFNDDKDIDIFV